MQTVPISDSSLGRHADAIFTNSYRKVLGQISARKFLQTIMGKRLGWVTQVEWNRSNVCGLPVQIASERGIIVGIVCFFPHRDGSESYMKRQSDIYEGTYKEHLTAIQRNQRYRGVHGNVLRHRYTCLQSLKSLNIQTLAFPTTADSLNWIFSLYRLLSWGGKLYHHIFLTIFYLFEGVLQRKEIVLYIHIKSCEEILQPSLSLCVCVCVGARSGYSNTQIKLCDQISLKNPLVAFWLCILCEDCLKNVSSGPCLYYKCQLCYRFPAMINRCGLDGLLNGRARWHLHLFFNISRCFTRQKMWYLESLYGNEVHIWSNNIFYIYEEQTPAGGWTRGSTGAVSNNF